MLFPFKLGLGAKISTGKQPFPFIHIEDVVGAFVETIENNQFSGIFNLAAPQSITNDDFTKAFANSLKKSAFLTIPGFFLKLLFGEAAKILIESPEVIPRKLLDTGFNFRFKTINELLKSIV